MASGDPRWSRILLVEGVPGIGKSTLIDALVRRYVRDRPERKLRTLLHLTQAHTYGPLAADEDRNTLTVEQNLAHLDRVCAMLEWHVGALTDERVPKFLAVVDTLHLTHCHQPGVVEWRDVADIDRRLAALGAKVATPRRTRSGSAASKGAATATSSPATRRAIGDRRSRRFSPISSMSRRRRTLTWQTRDSRIGRLPSMRRSRPNSTASTTCGSICNGHVSGVYRRCCRRRCRRCCWRCDFTSGSARHDACLSAEAMRAHLFATMIVMFAVGCSGVPVEEPGVAGGALTQTGTFGGLNMYAYAPASMPASAPLVVALHGCSQTATEYVNAGWNEMADLAKFYVVYAEVPGGGCFNWTSASDTKRDSGQALAIKQMVDDMKAKHSIDAGRVFVTGLSAGGAMTTVMLATYPDVFSAGAPMAGIAYGSGLGGGGDPKTLGDSVRNAFPTFHGPYPRISVWQGQSDSIVAPSNATTIINQWTNVHAQAGTPTGMDSVSGAMHAIYAVQGQTAVESYLIPGMGHGTAVKVGFAPAGGCGHAASYMIDAGICSTYYAGVFFGLLQGPPMTDGGVGATDDLGSGGSGGGGSGGGTNGGGGSGGGDPSAPRSDHSGCAAVAGATSTANVPLGLVLFGVVIAMRGVLRRTRRRPSASN
jgi:poly(hydroxyalkanoate) depolymerase family esterase